MATQTGSIDLTASNSVKLAAEAGWQSDLENYATKAELDVQADRIGMVVANNDASSSLQLTADAMTYIGNNVTIKGTDGTTTAISGGRIQANSLSIGALDSAAQSATLNSNISVGGRNIAKASDAVVTPTTYGALRIYLSEPLEAEQTYVFQLWDVDVSHSAKSTAQLGVDVYYCGGNIKMSGWHGSAYFTNGHADHLQLILTPHSSAATDAEGGSETTSNPISGASSVTNKYINLYNSVPSATGTMNLTVGKWKLEKGNKATDWTPAPEDVDSAISDAAKTATSYVTDINSNGITIHPSRSDYATNGGRAVINGDGLTIYLGSDDVASYGASARIGKSNSDRVTVDSTNGITIYKGNSKKLQTTANGIDVYGSDGTTSVASFGSTARLGSTSSGNYLVMNSNGLNLYNELDGTNYSSRIGPSSVSLLGGNFYLESSIEGGTASTFYDTVLSQIYSSVRTSLTLRVTKDKNTSTTSRSIITNSPLSVTGRIDATSQITGTYQLVATGKMNEIALRANTVGYRGLYDVTNDEWILYRDGNNDNLVIKFLSSNFDIDAAVALSGSTSISANGLQTGTTNITKSGWVPVAIAGVNVNSHWAATVRWYLSARDSGTGTISWAVHNMSGTAAITPTVTFYVLWVRA